MVGEKGQVKNLDLVEIIGLEKTGNLIVERTKSTLVGMGADADELDALIKKATANVVFY